MRVALLVGEKIDNILDHVLVVGDATFGAYPEGPNPRGLPIFTEGDALILGSVYAGQVARQHGVDVAGELIPRLRQRFDRVIGFDQEPSFELDFEPEVMEALDAVVRPHGVYADLSLYDWDVGAHSAKGRWTERTVPVPRRPTAAGLARLHLAVPFLVAECVPIRAAMRRHRRQRGEIGRAAATARSAMDLALGFVPPMFSRLPPPRTAQFVGAYTHVQRADAVRAMRALRLRCDAGITSVHSTVNGLRGDGRFHLDAAGQAAVAADLDRQGLLVARRPRLRYRLDMLACKAVVSIVGHGEMCWRMAEALWMRRILVTQNLDHVRAMFPFVNAENVVFCRPDLADLIDVLDDIECNFGRYLPIAEKGHADFLDFSARSLALVDDALAPLRGPVSRPA